LNAYNAKTADAFWGIPHGRYKRPATKKEKST